MNVSKSINFLLLNAGDVLKYRLHKEILKDINKTEEENLLEKIMQTPYYKLVESYVKPNGYIGVGMHSWEKFKETPLQDGESAARLLSNYAIPKDTPIITNFINAIRSDDILKQEFSYYNPEIARYNNRFLGINNGGGLMVLIYTMQALLGFDDAITKPFINISLNAFKNLLNITSLDDITTFNSNSKKKYNYPFIEEDIFFPCQYHLETLSYTNTWRNEENINTLISAINHQCKIMTPDNNLHIKIKNNYYAPLWGFVRPFEPFTLDTPAYVALRKTITNLAKIGGNKIDVVHYSANIIKQALEKDGILRVNFSSPYQKKYFKLNMQYPGAYSEISLEENHKTDIKLWCELTFWAVQLLRILGECEV